MGNSFYCGQTSESLAARFGRLSETLRAKFFLLGAVVISCILPTNPANAQNVLIPYLSDDFVYDNTNDVLLMTKTWGEEIGRFDATTETMLTSYNLGAPLRSIDITPDNQFAYVGRYENENGQGAIKKVDVATGAVTDLLFDAHNGCCGSEYGVHDVSIANNGTALFTTRGAGSNGFSIRELDLATGEISKLKGLGGRSANLHRGADRSTIFVENWTASGEPIFSYDAETKTFPLSFSTYRNIGGKPAAVNRDGSQYALTNSLMDDDWDVLEIFPNVYAGYTFDPLRDILYYSDYAADEIVIYDSVGLSELGRVAIGEDIGGSNRIEISDDTTRLFVRTPSGVRMIDNPLPATASASNASFDTAADLDVLDIDFGTLFIQDEVAPIDFDISNLLGAGLTANLNLESFSGSGDLGAFSTDLLAVANLTRGDSHSFSASIDTSTPGAYNSSYTLNFSDILGTDQTLTLNLSGEIITPDPANASFATDSDLNVLNLDFGAVGLNPTAAPLDFDIANLLGAGPTADLDLVSILDSGDTSVFGHDLAPFVDMLAGDFASFQATFDTSTIGNYGASYDLNFTDVAGNDQTLTLNLAGEVLAPLAANASFSTSSDVDVLDIDLGSVLLNDPNATAAFQIANLLDGAPTADLELVSIIGSGDTGMLLQDLAPFDDLAAGDSFAFEAELDANTPGEFAASYLLNFTDLLGNEQSLTLNLSGDVVFGGDPAIPNLIYNAATGNVILDPDGAGGIIGYTLQTIGDVFLFANHIAILGGVSTSLADDLSEASLAPVTSPLSIGKVFPVGMNITELYNMLSTNQVSTGLGSPLLPFDLFLISGAPVSLAVPEPSTYALGAFSLLALGVLAIRRSGKLTRGAVRGLLCLIAIPMLTLPAAAASILIPFSADNFAYDNTNEMLYMIRRDHGSIGRYDASADALLPSYNVGANLRGIDIGLNDQYIYVGEGNAGVTQGFVRKVDVATGAKTNIAYSASGRTRGVVDLSIASNNKLFFTTTFAGSGPTGLGEIDLATDTVTNRRSLWQNTSMVRGPDRSYLFFQNGSISSDPIFSYDANTDTFPAGYDSYANANFRASAVNRDGSLVAYGDRMLDRDLNLVSTLSVPVGATQFDPQRDMLYVSDYNDDEIVVFETNGFTEIGRFEIEGNTGRGYRMTMSDDTDRLFVRTSEGVRMVENPFSANAVASNASFDSSLDQDVLNLDFGTLAIQDVVGPLDFEISNLVGAGVTTNLNLQSIASSGDVGTISTDLATFSDLGAGASQSFASSIDTSVVGTYNTSYDLSFTDFLGNDQTLTLNITGTVITPDAANASFSSASDVNVLNLDFGSAYWDQAAAPIDFDISNLAGGGLTADLDLVSVVGSGDTSVLSSDVSPFVDLLAGDSSSFQATFDTSNLGAYQASYDLNFTDYLGNDQLLTINLTGEVLPPAAANASFSSASDIDVLDLDVGSVQHNDSDATAAFDIANLIGGGASTADLELVSIIGSGDTASLLHDLSPFNDLQAGSSLPFQAILDSATPGVFASTYLLNFTDLLGNDQSLTLNLSGEVVLVDDPAVPDLIYNATTGEVILDPDGAGSIIGYTLVNTSDSFLPGNFNPVLGGVFTGLTGELSEANLTAITSPASIGNVFPAGLNSTQLFNLLSRNEVSTGLGAPLVPFDLRIVLNPLPSSAPVPEPSTYVMAAVALMGLGLVCRRRRR